jgi:low affinity Fe/Cu permease
MIGFALAVFVVWIATIPARTLDLHGFVLEATTMITFLIVFVLQRAQNRDMKAIHVKLDELIAAIDGASNRVIKAEEASDELLEQVHEASKQLAKSVLEESKHTGALTIEDHLAEIDRERVLEAVVSES